MPSNDRTTGILVSCFLLDLQLTNHYRKAGASHACNPPQVPYVQSTSMLVFKRVVGSITYLASADGIAHAQAIEYQGGGVDGVMDSYTVQLSLGDDFHLGRSAAEWVIVP